jgi:mRNA interferase RelE/StbE
MNLQFTERFRRSYQKLPPDVQVDFKKPMQKLLSNPTPAFHLALRIEKIQGIGGISELTVNMETQLTFEFTKDGILLRNMGEHDLTLKRP